MHVFALNCGSSSIKSALIDTVSRQRLLDIRVLELGSAACRLVIDGRDQKLDADLDLRAGVQRIFRELAATSHEVAAVAHRIVHGGVAFTQPTLLDETTLATLAGLNSLAPLHNPPALAAVEEARSSLPSVPHVAVFDTAFHVTLPTRAREYALPRDLCKRLGIRRYGFHGTSHAHVMNSAAAYLQQQPQQLRIISCHLGNGASVAAIEYGRSVETSMGMTPLEGLVMGTRCGDVDPGVLLRIQQVGGMSAEALARLLNNESGLQALAGTSDLGSIEQRAAAGEESCRLALTLYSHRVRKYIGAYAAVMGGVDIIAFTGGIGEHSALMRHRILQRLEFIGVFIDEERNRTIRVDHAAPVAAIAQAHSRVGILVIQADEELTMALEVAELLERRSLPTTALSIPVAISARHAHLSQPTIDRLFGQGHQLRPRTALSQPGQYAAQESVTLIGPRGRIDKVRVMGPPRAADQIEISRTDEFTLGIDAPVRISGDVSNTPGITLEGPGGQVNLGHGVITARRHIHMSPQDAARFGLRDHDSVEVRIDSDGRDLIFGDVVVRVSPQFRLELHLDTDEANAAGIQEGTSAQVSIGERRITGRSA